ncbi:MAG: NAD(P)-dependent oxidoreductase [Candidatus Omnitrophica bacterium]|nr:NAD(P)-dependent oxidoreductase [Candidatus Omnitrophota bacterium]
MTPEAWWKDKKVLVTGGAGFLGSHLLEALVAQGARVTAIDLLERPPRLESLLPRMDYLPWDLSGSGLEDALPGSFDLIFHLAASSFPAEAERAPLLAYRHNVLGTANILSFAARRSARKFLFPSAGALYTNTPKYLPIDEEHPIDPTQGVYAMTKRMGELLCQEFMRNQGLKCLFFRLFNAYGPGQSREFLIPSFIQQALSEGRITVWDESVRRDFNYVQDVVRALMAGAASEACGGPINLGSGRDVSVGEIARRIAAFFPAQVQFSKRETFGPRRQQCDNRRAKELLGWEPAISLEEGLKRTLESFRREAVKLQEAIPQP